MKARAKINLALDVLGKRDDGYHDMRSIMQTLYIHDGLFIKKIHKQKFKLVCNLKWLPVDSENLVYRAANLLIEKFDIKTGIFIELNKNIPIAAGLAGGSSDCAATLLGMRKLFNLPISNSELFEIGKSLGADIPYCMKGGTILAEGLGEVLTKIPPHPQTLVVLAKPSFSLSTATVFKKFDSTIVTERPNIDKMIVDIKNQDVTAIAKGFCNVLESVSINMHPEINRLKQIMISNNAIGSLMSGSGPTVFGYFKNKSDAISAIRAIKRDMPSTKEIFLTSVYNVYN